MAGGLALLQCLASLAKYNIQAELNSVIKRCEGFKSKRSLKGIIAMADANTKTTKKSIGKKDTVTVF